MRIYNEKGLVNPPEWFDRSLIHNMIQSTFLRMIQSGYDVQDSYYFLLESLTACLDGELDKVRKSIRAHEAGVQPIYNIFDGEYELKRAVNEV